MTTKRTMTLNLTDAEMSALDELSARKDLTKTAVLRQALRLYQTVEIRIERGDKLLFENEVTKEKAELMLVGEQPGDAEDLEGHPFVGPAGAILDRALHEAGISRKDVFVSNAVKHFKFEPRGKRRLHAKPNTGEI